MRWGGHHALTAEAVYMTYVSRFAELRAFAPDELRGPAPLRLYRATIAEHSVLVRGSDPVFGQGVDTRIVVMLSRCEPH